MACTTARRRLSLVAVNARINARIDARINARIDALVYDGSEEAVDGLYDGGGACRLLQSMRRGSMRYKKTMNECECKCLDTQSLLGRVQVAIAAKTKILTKEFIRAQKMKEFRTTTILS
jgi:hypothetical protein